MKLSDGNRSQPADWEFYKRESNGKNKLLFHKHRRKKEKQNRGEVYYIWSVTIFSIWITSLPHDMISSERMHKWEIWITVSSTVYYYINYFLYNCKLRTSVYCKYTGWFWTSQDIQRWLFTFPNDTTTIF